VQAQAADSRRGENCAARGGQDWSPPPSSPSRPPEGLHDPVAGQPPVLTAQAACLLDARPGGCVEHRSHARMFPASLTKMMTACCGGITRPDEGLPASKVAAETGESSINLQLHEPLQLLQVLEGSLIKSANDATVMVRSPSAGRCRRSWT